MQHLTLSQDNKLVQVIVEPRYRWLRHLLLFLLLIVSYNATLITYAGSLSVLGRKVFILAFLQLCLYMGIAYLNIYVLVPRLFLRRRYSGYFLALIGALSLDFFSIYWLEFLVHRVYDIEPTGLSYLNPQNSLLMSFISDSMIFGMCLTGTTITVLFRRWFTDGERRNLLEAEEYRTQLLRIKNSINPAFLSGTLLKAADQTLQHPTGASGILGRLSRFLRYRLYDSNRDKVMLNSEAAFLENYLSLISDIRSGFAYSIVRGDSPLNATLPPSLLINITDILLGELTVDAEAALDIKLSADAGTVFFDISASSAGIGAAYDHVEKQVREILGLTFPGGYGMTASWEKDRIAVHITTVTQKNRCDGD